MLKPVPRKVAIRLRAAPPLPWQPEPGGGAGECAHCLPIKAEEGPRRLGPLSGQGVGGAAVARSGITGPVRQEPDPGACLGQPSHPPFLQLRGSGDADRGASVLEVQGDFQSAAPLLGRLLTKGV